MNVRDKDSSAQAQGADDRIQQRFGLGNVDWQQRIDWNVLRRKRVERAQYFLAKHGLGAALVYNHDRKRYLSAVWNHPYARHVPRDFVLFVRGAGFPYVSVSKHTDRSRVVEDCPWLEGRLMNEDELFNPRIYRYQSESEAQRKYGLTVSQIKSLLQAHGVAGLPVSVDYSTPGMIHALESAGFKVVDGTSWIDECGMVKFDEEILCMKTAAAINEAGYGAVLREARIGMRENELQGIMARAMYEAGAEYYEGWVVAAGERTNPRSFNWSDRPLRPCEFLTLEACHVNWCGYKVCYDRTFLMGARPNELQREIYQTAVEMHAKFQELLRPGVSLHELADKRPKPGVNLRTAEQIRQWRATWSNHFGGMGIAWDSAPYYYSAEDPDFVLERNMTIAYHAMMWTDSDEGGVAIENTYRITANGCESLTKWPYQDIMVLGL
ncbi:MAG: aminopeptidase P family protein [Burkholderiales bacterium]|nr:aminopeptidase P family protein [Burkholderiales bacterium]